MKQKQLCTRKSQMIIFIIHIFQYFQLLYNQHFQQILLHKMDSQSNQQNKQQRRKRKDPQSRDFVCKCGKSYLSYAAAYTHVKNKHGGDNEHLTNISKPDREKLKRGRPKQKKVFSITTQTQKLSIVEEAILQIYESLQKANNAARIILQGNQQVRLDELMSVYEELKKEMGDPGLKLFIQHHKYGDSGKILNEFIQSINKHFIPQVAAKLIWMINYIFSTEINVVSIGDQILEINIDNVKQKINDEKILKLWDDNAEIPEFVITALQKWVKTVEKQNKSLRNQ